MVGFSTGSVEAVAEAIEYGLKGGEVASFDDKLFEGVTSGGAGSDIRVLENGHLPSLLIADPNAPELAAELREQSTRVATDWSAANSGEKLEVIRFAGSLAPALREQVIRAGIADSDPMVKFAATDNIQLLPAAQQEPMVRRISAQHLPWDESGRNPEQVDQDLALQQKLILSKVGELAPQAADSSFVINHLSSPAWLPESVSSEHYDAAPEWLKTRIDQVRSESMADLFLTASARLPHDYDRMHVFFSLGERLRVNPDLSSFGAQLHDRLYYGETKASDAFGSVYNEKEPDLPNLPAVADGQVRLYRIEPVDGPRLIDRDEQPAEEYTGRWFGSSPRVLADYVSNAGSRFNLSSVRGLYIDLPRAQARDAAIVNHPDVLRFSGYPFQEYVPSAAAMTHVQEMPASSLRYAVDLPHKDYLELVKGSEPATRKSGSRIGYGRQLVSFGKRISGF